MKNIISILLLISGINAFGQLPSNPNWTQFSTGNFKQGYHKADSAHISAIRDTFNARYPGSRIMWQRTGIDTSEWYFTGQRWLQNANSSGAGVQANNGLSLSGNIVQLGQAFNAPGNPATLLQDTEIPLNSDTLLMDSGYVRITGINTSVPPLIVRNLATNAFEVAYFRGPNAAVRMFADKTDGFVGFTYYTGGTLRWATGYDGVFPHAYICDLKNGTTSGTFESEGATFGGVTYTKNMFLGDPTTPDTARFNLHTTGSYTASNMTNRWFNGSNYNSTFNTTSGAITNRTFMLDNSASRSTGSNALTNVTLWLRARNAQTNRALFVDSGTVVVHNDFSGSALAQVAIDDLFIVNNAASTQPRQEMHLSRSVRYNDTLALTETFSTTLAVQSLYQAKAHVALTDNLMCGSALEAGYFLRRNTAYTGAVLFQGAVAPTNTVTTMPSALVSRFDMSAVQGGANSIRAQGYWASFTAWYAGNTGNSIGRFAWINTGAAQEGGTMDTGYAIFINALPTAMVTRKYAIGQMGSADTNFFAGITRHASLATGSATDSIMVTNNGVTKRMLASAMKSPFYNPQSGTTYTVLTSDASTIIGLSNTAARTITLAAANAFPAGTIIGFKDEAGTAAAGNITINRAGSDTVDGATSTVITTNYGMIWLYTNGSNAWFVW